MLTYRPKPDDVDLSMFRRAQSAAEVDLAALEAGEHVYSIVGFAWFANWHWANAVFRAKPDKIRGVRNVDWMAWRKGLDFSDLFIRSWSRLDSRTFDHDVTLVLELALSRMLTNQPQAALRVLAGRQKDFITAIDRINSGIKRGRLHVDTGDLGPIGFLLHELTGSTPKHPAFLWDESLFTRAGLERTIEARSHYAKGRREEGGLLYGYSQNHIPLELIFLNSLLPETERLPPLSSLAAQIAGTDYPDDPLYDSYDARLLNLGL